MLDPIELDESINSTTRNDLGALMLAEDDLLDIEYLDMIDSDLNAIIPLYLMALYSYYESDSPIISDKYFSKMTNKMLDNWDKIVHNHKHLLSNTNRDGLKFEGTYPKQIHNAVRWFKEAHYGKKSLGVVGR